MAPLTSPVVLLAGLALWLNSLILLTNRPENVPLVVVAWFSASSPISEYLSTSFDSTVQRET